MDDWTWLLVVLACVAAYLSHWMARFLAKKIVKSTLGPKRLRAKEMQFLFTQAVELLQDGRKRESKPRLQEAVEALDKALAIDPSDCACLICKGLALEMLGDVNGCLEALDEALKLDAERPRREQLPPKERAEAHAKRGEVLLFRKKRPERALLDFEMALEYEPSNGKVLAMLGRCYEAKRQWETARFLYADSLKHKGKGGLVDPEAGLKRVNQKGPDEDWGPTIDLAD